MSDRQERVNMQSEQINQELLTCLKFAVKDRCIKSGCHAYNAGECMNADGLCGGQYWLKAIKNAENQAPKSVWHGPDEKPHCDSYASAVIIVFNYVDQTDKRTELIRACSLEEVTKTRNVHKWAYMKDLEAME